MTPYIPYYQSSIDRLRLALMLCVCLNLFGVPTAYGTYLQIGLNFAPCAFFILSGFLVLRESENRNSRILRAIRRSGVTFAALFVGYLALNLLLERGQTLPMLSSWRFWFDFLVLNRWNLPIGNPIWFVQAIFYAYVILYFLHRRNLLRFDWLIAAVFLVIGLLTGELSGLLHFHFGGEDNISGNFFTRALPYLLLGHLLRRSEHFLLFVRFHALPLIVAGLALMVGEGFLLSRLGAFTYYGHLLGMGVVAVATCSIAVTLEDVELPPFYVFSFLRNARLLTYYLCSPVFYAVTALLNHVEMGAQFTPYAGLLVIIVCLFISFFHELLLFLLWLIGVAAPEARREEALLNANAESAPASKKARSNGADTKATEKKF